MVCVIGDPKLVEFLVYPGVLTPIYMFTFCKYPYILEKDQV